MLRIKYRKKKDNEKKIERRTIDEVITREKKRNCWRFEVKLLRDPIKRQTRNKSWRKVNWTVKPRLKRATSLRIPGTSCPLLEVHTRLRCLVFFFLLSRNTSFPFFTFLSFWRFTHFISPTVLLFFRIQPS